MPQDNPNRAFTPDELAAIAQDPRFTDEHLSLLTPSERTQLTALRRQSSLSGKMREFAGGAGKELLERPVQLSQLLDQIIGLSSGGKDFQAQDPEAIVDTLLNSGRGGATEDLGRNTEQFLEFFTPLGRAAQLKAISGLARAIPANAGPKVATLLNKLAAVTGRATGEAATAGAVSATHGDTTPGGEATIAALGPTVLGPLAAKTGKFALNTGGELLEWLGGILGMKALGGGGGSVAGRIGAFGLAKGATRGVVDAVQELTEGLTRRQQATGTRLVGEAIGRTGVAMHAQPRPSRRRLGEGR